MSAIEKYDEPSTAVVQHQQHTISDLAMLADRIARTNMVPSTLKGKPEEILATFMYGAECGLPVMQSLQLIDMIQGRPTLNAQGQRALILGAGHQFWIEESTTEKATACGIRKGTDRVVSASFTIAEARERGLMTKDPWKKSPADMLVARATTRLARQAFSDVTLGLAYDAEELQQGGVLVNAHMDEKVYTAGELEEPRTISPENVARISAKCDEAGVDVAAVILLATDGRTDDPAGLLVNEVAAARDALAALVDKTSAPAEELEVKGEAPSPPVGGEEPAVSPGPAGTEPLDPALQPWVDTAAWSTQKRRFFGICSKRWPSLDSKDRDAARKQWLQDNFSVDSVKALDPDTLMIAADRLEDEVLAMPAEQPSLDDIITDAEVVE